MGHGLGEARRWCWKARPGSGKPRSLNTRSPWCRTRPSRWLRSGVMRAMGLLQTSETDFTFRGEGMGLTQAQWTSALLYNGLARYDDALTAAEQALEDPHELWFSTGAAVKLIEAASHTGNAEPGTRSVECWRATPARAGAIGVWVSRPARARSSATATQQRVFMARQSNGCGARACAWTSPCPPFVRRMAAARTPPPRRARPAADRA